MNWIREKKAHKMLLTVMAVVTFFLLVGNVVAQMEWQTKIARFEDISPVYRQTVDVGTTKEELNMPDTLRAIVPYDGTQYIFVAADPGELAQEYGYVRVEDDALEEEQESAAPVESTTPVESAAPVESTTPVESAAPVESATSQESTTPVESAAPEESITPQEKPILYTYTQGDDIQYRVYGSLDGGENQWFACDQQGSIIGVVQDVPVTWACEEYHEDVADTYVFTAQLSGYTCAQDLPYAQVTVEESEELTQRDIEAKAEGVTFTVSGLLPQQAQLSVTKQELGTEEVESLLADQLINSVELETYAAYDITILVDGQEWQPKEPVQVSVDQAVLAGTQATEIQVAHIAGEGGKTSATADTDVDTTVQGERAVFETDGFSLYVFYTVRYTVDFHYNDVTYHMEGGSSMLLSQLFVELGIEKNAADAVSVVFSDPTLLGVEEQERDWNLISLKPFHTTETLTLSFLDGSMQVIKVTDAVYIGNTTVNKIPSNRMEVAWRSSGVKVTTWGGYVQAKINNGASTTNIMASGTVQNPSIPAGSTLVHATYWSALEVNGVLYDVDVYVKTKVGFFYPFSYGLTYNTNDNSMPYLRSFITQHTSGGYIDQWKRNYEPGQQLLGVQLYFYKAGTNRSQSATLPTLAYGNFMWNAHRVNSVELFDFQDYGYGLYSTVPQHFYYDTTYHAWGAKPEYGATNGGVLWSFAVNIPSLTFGQRKDASTSRASGSGLELVLGHVSPDVNANLSLSKTVGNGSGWGNETFQFKTQPSNSAGTPTTSFNLTSTSNSLTLPDTATSKTLSNYTSASFNVAGTYYAVITETAGTNSKWKYDSSKWLATIVVDQDKTTLELSVPSITYRNLTTGATSSTAAVFTNYYTVPITTNVSVKKTVTTAADSASASFTFNVAQSNDSGSVASSSAWTLTDTSETATFTKADSANGKTITFGTATFKTPGTYYAVITETAGAVQGWTYDTSKWLVTFQVTRSATDYSLSVTKTYKKVGTSTTGTAAAFVNYYTAPITTNVSVNKTVITTAASASESFTFNVAKSNSSGTVTANSTWILEDTSKTATFSKGSADFTFGTATFTAPGTYYAVITEQAGNADKWTYDTSKWLVTFQVTRNAADYSLSVTKTYTKVGTTTTGTAAAFVNHYTAPVITDMSVTKTVQYTGDAPAAGVGRAFTFTAAQSDASGAVTSSGTWTLANATITQDFGLGSTPVSLGSATFYDVGTYYAVITETANNPGIGWVNDTSKWLVKFDVTLNADYSLKVTKTYTNLSTGATSTSTATFVNTYRSVATLSVTKIVENYGQITTTTGSKNQDFMIRLEGPSSVTGMALAHGETSGTMTVQTGYAGVQYDIWEIVPMEYALTDIQIENTSDVGEQEPWLRLYHDSEGNITGGTLTVYPENQVEITVYNTFTHTGYFKDKVQVDNVFTSTTEKSTAQQGATEKTVATVNAPSLEVQASAIPMYRRVEWDLVPDVRPLWECVMDSQEK